MIQVPIVPLPATFMSQPENVAWVISSSDVFPVTPLAEPDPTPPETPAVCVSQ